MYCPYWTLNQCMSVSGIKRVRVKLLTMSFQIYTMLIVAVVKLLQYHFVCLVASLPASLPLDPDALTLQLQFF